MSVLINTLPSLETTVGSQYHRLRGIKSWEDLEILGKTNLERLIQLAQENVYKLISDVSLRDELKEIRHAINYITNQLLPIAPKKPLLPRLRSECFSKNDEVCIYIKDSEGSIAESDWVKASITKVEKSYKADWYDALPNSGYYWRLTATSKSEIFPRECFVAFSTSEPRVLFSWEYNYLKSANQLDPQFLEIFSQNAWREWFPLWCLERGSSCAGKAMDMKAWLLQGKLSST